MLSSVHTNLQSQPLLSNSAGKIPTWSERVSDPCSPFPDPTVAGVCPPFSDHFLHPSKPFRINTCKSVSKQTTLTFFRMNTYEKHRGVGVLLLTRHPAKDVCPAFPEPACARRRSRGERVSRGGRVEGSLPESHERFPWSAGHLYQETVDSIFQHLSSNLHPLTCGIIPPHTVSTRFQERGGFSE